MTQCAKRNHYKRYVDFLLMQSGFFVYAKKITIEGKGICLLHAKYRMAWWDLPSPVPGFTYDSIVACVGCGFRIPGFFPIEKYDAVPSSW